MSDIMADAEIAVEEAVGFLQKTSSATGGSVFDHLTDIVSTILAERPHDAVDVLETSYVLKRTKQLRDIQNEGACDRPPPTEDDVARVEACRKLFKDPDVAVDAETGQPIETEPPNEYTCQDVVHDGHLFDALGVGLGPEETCAVALMAKRLGEDPAFQVEHVRFFGKFFGIQRDYYVFETSLKQTSVAEEIDSQDDDTPMEVGAGANAYVYFVCNEAGDVFQRLPDVKPQHIRVARTLRRFLTGRLEADVSAFPLFDGNESEFLRAQIARISCATVLCPAGHFSLSEEGVVEKCEETPHPAAGELKELSNWVHLNPHLKRQGRCVLHVRKAPEGEEEGFELTEEEQEEGPALLSAADQDVVLSGQTPWTVILSSHLHNQHHQVVGWRSQSWPGAVSVAKGTHYANLYVGWGFKDVPYEPPPFPVIQSEHEAVSWAESTAQPLPPSQPDETTDEA